MVFELFFSLRDSATKEYDPGIYMYVAYRPKHMYLLWFMSYWLMVYCVYLGVKKRRFPGIVMWSTLINGNTGWIQKPGNKTLWLERNLLFLHSSLNNRKLYRNNIKAVNFPKYASRPKKSWAFKEKYNIFWCFLNLEIQDSNQTGVFGKN